LQYEKTEAYIVMEEIKHYSCYFFDADGTLMDTSELIYQSYVHVISRFNGRPASREEIYAGIGIPLWQQLAALFGDRSDSEIDEITEAYRKYQFDITGDYLKLFPGVKEVLATLKEQGKKCAVVTSRMLPSLSAYFKQLGIHDFFDYFVTPELTEKHKPGPEPVLKALDLCRAAPGEALMTGDSVYDLQSAARAGVHSCFVNWSLIPLDTTIVVPTYRINRMEELVSL
jgi:pyrophosphatase PpaX